MFNLRLNYQRQKTIKLYRMRKITNKFYIYNEQLNLLPENSTLQLLFFPLYNFCKTTCLSFYVILCSIVNVQSVTSNIYVSLFYCGILIPNCTELCHVFNMFETQSSWKHLCRILENWIIKYFKSNHREMHLCNMEFFHVSKQK